MSNELRADYQLDYRQAKPNWFAAIPQRYNMPATEPQRSPEELARIGAEVFNRSVRPSLRPEDAGKYVAIDIVSGDHEIDADDYTAVTRLLGRNPAAEVWLERAGEPTAYRMGRG